MFIILAYDIPDDRRRTRLFKTLKRFGFAVQESVFEFHLNQGELRALKKPCIPSLIQPLIKSGITTFARHVIIERK